MQDKYGRTIDYLRVSVTDRCNLRCSYCMPKCGVSWEKMSRILTYEEIAMICRAGADLGISKIKITGGEPLVRLHLDRLIRMLYAIPGIEDVTLTTNGVLLCEQARKMRDAGIKSINVSLDTLSRDTYKEITGFDRLGDVLKGIDQAVEMGFWVKLNVVLGRDLFADRETFIANLMELVQMAKTMPISVRFIELMPIGQGTMHENYSSQDLLSDLQGKYPEMYPDETLKGNGPAVYYRIPGFIGNIGVISAIHGKFCDQCNRLRLTSTGFLRPCLGFDQGIDLRQILRGSDGADRPDNDGADRMDREAKYRQYEALKQAIIRAVNEKPKAHCFDEAEKNCSSQKMVKIGG